MQKLSEQNSKMELCWGLSLSHLLFANLTPPHTQPRMSKIELIITKHQPSPAKIKIKITSISLKRPYLSD